ncbi:symmetrical bis(5'-nucleosyl)-tetraphosphatase [Marinomonas ostreistagni]|uniref:symmetrical bis(5'-nucleosyl)-tetraphosphatase n=1 Tax=Marinomonas ostreistagni TaxID=359209 RepID=UPI00194F7405|nr:symmetrical bis(5'-nucleosyl)-tetraphosphatase [Marinomonas ostreistagni]MBM6551505.1 symmetrical bis(5'-nucleosyl)-tetraphosphatase [Marinomonas ostreistagni]
MSTYVIGDLQGCFSPLLKLLEQIQYDPEQDTLWFAGDLINRGKECLETLRFVSSLGDKAKVVLGNHDLHLLAVSYGFANLKRGDTLWNILQASDRDELMEWLRQQPLCHYDADFNTIMTHAGIPPNWTIEETLRLSKEVESTLQSEQVEDFLQVMYGNKPDTWSESLTGMDRLRCITNYLTRMRFCRADGKLDLKSKEGPNTARKDYLPWFMQPNRLPSDTRVVFGHWAALEGVTNSPNIHALDTGCVWGGALSALRLEDNQRFSTPCNLY